MRESRLQRRRASCHECGYCDNIPRLPSRPREFALPEGGLPGLRDAEYRQVAEEVLARVKARLSRGGTRFVPVAVSARHIHLTRESLDTVYGKGHELSKLRDLSQPGQYAASETLTIIGTRMRTIEGVRILGPLRDYTQVELARTDGITLGIDLPVRDSGKLSGSSPIVLIGPAGALALQEGAIRATRHIHASDRDAAALSLKDGQCVSVRVPGEKGVVFDNVLVRTGASFALEMHLDTDDANAADVYCDMLVEILLR